MGIKENLKEDLLGPHREHGQVASVATIVNSYYDKGVSGNANVMVDVAFLDSAGTATDIKYEIPVIKQGGLAQAVPPIGAEAILISLGSNKESLICLGYIESKITTRNITDDKTVAAPPQVLFK